MAKFIQEHEFLNENINKLEERLNTQYARILDTKPTYTTYYQINPVMSTTDNGFLDAQSSIGPNSPIRYNEIKTFPIYGLEQIQLQLEDSEWGLDTNYDGEGIILPQTIKPTPGDWFVIDYLNIQVMFYVNSVNFDTIKSNNYYRISFHVRVIDADIKQALKNQIVDKFTCNIKNVGSIENVIIRDDVKKIMDDAKKVIEKVKDLYKKVYYKNQYNSFITDKNSYCTGEQAFYYDRSLSFFIQQEGLYTDKYQLDTIYLLNEDYDDRFELEYELSFFKRLSDRDLSFLSDVYKYVIVSKKNMHSSFSFYRKNMKYIQTTSIDCGYNYIEPELIDYIRRNDVSHGDSRYNLIVKYFNKSISSPFQLENEVRCWYNDIVKWFTDDDMAFRLVPICIFCMQRILKDISTL